MTIKSIVKETKEKEIISKRWSDTSKILLKDISLNLLQSLMMLSCQNVELKDVVSV